MDYVHSDLLYTTGCCFDCRMHSRVGVDLTGVCQAFERWTLDCAFTVENNTVAKLTGKSPALACVPSVGLIKIAMRPDTLDD